jgi:hypothetical protein
MAQQKSSKTPWIIFGIIILLIGLLILLLVPGNVEVTDTVGKITRY